MNETRGCTRLEDTLLLGTHKESIEEHLRTCAECAALRDEYGELLKELYQARQPVGLPLNWRTEVFKRIRQIESERPVLVSLDDERRRRGVSAGARVCSETTATSGGRRAGHVETLTHRSGGLRVAAAVQVVEALCPGVQVAGKYLLREQIGDGATGQVWVATNESTCRDVALKVLTRLEDNDRRDPWRELCVKHRNIVDVFDAGYTRTGYPFVVMELLHGETVADVLRRRGVLDAREAVHIARDVARALIAAHSASVLHLAISPRNIFLHREPDDDDGPVVKLLGFGLKDAGLSSAVYALSDGASNLVPYMSPEQLRVEVDLDCRADVWSLGVVLFELLTGYRPFGGTSSQVMMRVLAGEPPMLECFRRPIHPALASVVSRCLRHDRNDRIGAAAELLAELNRAAEQVGTTG